MYTKYRLLQQTIETLRIYNQRLNENVVKFSASGHFCGKRERRELTNLGVAPEADKSSGLLCMLGEGMGIKDLRAILEGVAEVAAAGSLGSPVFRSEPCRWNLPVALKHSGFEFEFGAIWQKLLCFELYFMHECTW